MSDYQELKNLGYTDREIFEDLGNAYFLAMKYETAVFWYKKLTEVSNSDLNSGYQERYHYALKKTSDNYSTGDPINKDWLAMVRADYEIKNKPIENRRSKTSTATNTLDFKRQSEQFLDARVLEKSFASLDDKGPAGQDVYKTPVAVTADGKTAFFSKAVYEKPLYGIFSKKELVHKIYKAERIGGQWKNISQVALCPKNYSTLHPTVSNDGRRLFFASDMPGTFGKYDIYVSAIHRDGSLGIPKNLGEKVNTSENDLYPNVVGGTTLFFASEGHKGYGGLDVFMVQVEQKRVGWSVNLGSPINSDEDDFSIFLLAEKGMGYVMSNRGKDKNAVQRVAFSYPAFNYTHSEDKWGYTLLQAFNDNSKTDYSNAFFEDE